VLGSDSTPKLLLIFLNAGLKLANKQLLIGCYRPGYRSSELRITLRRKRQLIYQKSRLTRE
jgi:hypothetical protein